MARPCYALSNPLTRDAYLRALRMEAICSDKADILNLQPLSPTSLLEP